MVAIFYVNIEKITVKQHSYEFAVYIVMQSLHFREYTHTCILFINALSYEIMYVWNVFIFELTIQIKKKKILTNDRTNLQMILLSIKNRENKFLNRINRNIFHITWENQIKYYKIYENIFFKGKWKTFPLKFVNQKIIYHVSEMIMYYFNNKLGFIVSAIIFRKFLWFEQPIMMSY